MAEKEIEDLYGGNEVFTVEEVETLKILEGRTYAILKKEEKMWRLKSRDLWLAEGDRNKKYFHGFVSHIRNINTIVEIWNSQGNMARKFQEKVEVGV